MNPPRTGVLDCYLGSNECFASLCVHFLCFMSFQGNERLDLKDISQIEQADFKNLLKVFILGGRRIWVDSKALIFGILNV